MNSWTVVSCVRYECRCFTDAWIIKMVHRHSIEWHTIHMNLLYFRSVQNIHLLSHSFCLVYFIPIFNVVIREAEWREWMNETHETHERTERTEGTEGTEIPSADAYPLSKLCKALVLVLRGSKSLCRWISLTVFCLVFQQRKSRKR